MPYRDYTKQLEASKKRYAALSQVQREAMRVYQRERVAKRRRILKAMSSLEACSICSGTSSRMHWHHLDKDHKLASISQMASRRWDIIISELCKCVPICPACHALHHTKERVRKNDGRFT